MNDKYLNMKNVKIMSLGLDACYLIIHCIMLLLFWRYDVLPMFYFNIFSIACYLFFPLLLLKEKYLLYVHLMYAEVAAHMTLAVYFVGWNSDFQIVLIGINIFLFYAEFLARSLKLPKFNSLWMSLVSAVLYIVSCFIKQYHEPQYSLPANVAFQLQIAWGITVFGISIFFLQLFVHLAGNSQEYLSEEMQHDSLTGLPNRYFMADYLDKVMESMDKRRYWLAMADLDDFKQVNDVYGHNCGDYVLKTLASLLRDAETGAEICRWGGEEFLLVGQMDPNMEAVEEKLNRLRRRVEGHAFMYDGQLLKLTVTIGISGYYEGDTVESWVNRADMKLYKGKCSGKNQVVA